MQSQIDKIKLTQKKQRETIIRMAKGMKYLEEAQSNNDTTMERLRSNIGRMNVTSSS